MSAHPLSRSPQHSCAFGASVRLPRLRTHTSDVQCDLTADFGYRLPPTVTPTPTRTATPTATPPARIFGITLDDLFGPGICAPSDKNDEGIPDLTQHLMCHNVVVSPATPATQLPSTIFPNDHSGLNQYGVYGPREFCVPSEVRIP